MIASPTPAAKLSPQQSRALVAQLRRSQVYRDYEHAFRETTGLPLTLRPLDEAGFQSLSQFNRVFRRIAGESPSTCRERLHGGAAR